MKFHVFVLIITLALFHTINGKARRSKVTDAALKAFAQGPSMLTKNYDREVRKAVDHKKFSGHPMKMAKKRGQIINDQFIPFSKLDQ